MSPFQLTIELVPETSWYNNLRSLMPKDAWQKLSRQVISEADNTCAICKSHGHLHCHEVWIYDDENHVQKLTGLQALCELCHGVKHIGFSQTKSKEYYEKVIAHFMEVNDCKRMDFERYKNEAFALFEERSKHEWRIDIGDHEGVNFVV